MTEYRPIPPPTAKQQIVRESPAVSATMAWAIPIIAERSKVAVDVIPNLFWQYNFHRFRVCSCFIAQQDPDANCTACFGTGFLPGYVPEGYWCFVTLEASDPGLIMVNVKPNFDSGSNPAPLELLDTALAGYVESTFLPAGANFGQFSSLYFAGSDAGLALSFTVDGLTWYPMDEVSHDFLKTASQVKFRATLTRASLSDPQPNIQVLQCRLQVQDVPLTKLDVPRWVGNLNSSDAGLIPILETFNAFADKDAKIEQTTLWVHKQSKRKFKVLTLNPNMPAGVLTSWDLTMRLIQPDESLNKIQ